MKKKHKHTQKTAGFITQRGFVCAKCFEVIATNVVWGNKDFGFLNKFVEKNSINIKGKVRKNGLAVNDNFIDAQNFLKTIPRLKDLRSSSRRKDIVELRRKVTDILRKKFGLSYPAIAKIDIGYKDHSGALRGVKARKKLEKEKEKQVKFLEEQKNKL